MKKGSFFVLLFTAMILMTVFDPPGDWREITHSSITVAVFLVSVCYYEQVTKYIRFNPVGLEKIYFKIIYLAPFMLVLWTGVFDYEISLMGISTIYIYFIFKAEYVFFGHAKKRLLLFLYAVWMGFLFAMSKFSTYEIAVYVAIYGVVLLPELLKKDKKIALKDTALLLSVLAVGFFLFSIIPGISSQQGLPRITLKEVFEWKEEYLLLKTLYLAVALWLSIGLFRNSFALKGNEYIESVFRVLNRTVAINVFLTGMTVFFTSGDLAFTPTDMIIWPMFLAIVSPEQDHEEIRFEEDKVEEYYE